MRFIASLDYALFWLLTLIAEGSIVFFFYLQIYLSI